MDMQVEEITQILRESPSVRLIKSRSVDFFLSFVIEAFEGQSAIMQERLHMLLENRLDEQENALVEDNLEMTRLGESNEQKAKRLIKDWTDKGFFTNYQNEGGEVIYEISPHKQTDGLGGELEKRGLHRYGIEVQDAVCPTEGIGGILERGPREATGTAPSQKNGDRASDSATGDGRRGRGV